MGQGLINKVKVPVQERGGQRREGGLFSEGYGRSTGHIAVILNLTKKRSSCVLHDTMSWFRKAT